MIRRPPRSTLFPTRRSSDLPGRSTEHCVGDGRIAARGVEQPLAGQHPLRDAVAQDKQGRSEEHTSELQSRLHLVCRLLLEKKKNNDLRPPAYPAPLS